MLGLKRGPKISAAPSILTLKNSAVNWTSCNTPSISVLLIDLKVCSRVYFCPFWVATLYRITSELLYYNKFTRFVQWFYHGS